MTKSFNCAACGAPVIAEPGAEVMACPYCGSALTIPPRLRRKAVPQPVAPQASPRDPFSAAASARLDEKTLERTQRETDMLADGLRKAQPVAQAAMQAYRYWVLARYSLPGCLAFAVIACLISCAALVAAAFFLGRLNF